jgi:hypothetical protein
MFTAVIHDPVSTFKYISVFEEAKQPAMSSAEVFPMISAWGFIDEKELADEMADSQPAPCSNSLAPEIDPDDFERIYHWFYS